jgi:hypothetical protein
MPLLFSFFSTCRKIYTLAKLRVSIPIIKDPLKKCTIIQCYFRIEGKPKNVLYTTTIHHSLLFCLCISKKKKKKKKNTGCSPPDFPFSNFSFIHRSFGFVPPPLLPGGGALNISPAFFLVSCAIHPFTPLEKKHMQKVKSFFFDCFKI